VGQTWEPSGSRNRSTESADASAAERLAAEPAAAPPPPSHEPAQHVAVITCMDARIDPLAVLGLRLGDANVLRNAGATVSDDVLRSLQAAESLLGVRRAVLMGHTDCAGHASDEAAASALADGARRIRDAMPDSFAVETLVYDVATGAVTPV